MASDLNQDSIARQWRSVFRPWSDVSSDPLPRFQNGPAFDLRNATILGWLSHAVYVDEEDRRKPLLARLGFHEVAHFSTQRLQWSQVSPIDDASTQLVVFRGTSDLRHWIFNMQTLLMPWPEGGKVHGGFARAYQRVAEALRAALERVRAEHLYFAGHSLGGALALFASTQFASTATYTFGCPRAGNPTFAKRAEEVPVYRIVHDQDLVTTIPYKISFLKDLAYKHAGTPIQLRPDLPLIMDDPSALPRSRESWKQALHAMLEGDHIGEPLPALQDHAPSRYVRALREAAAF